MKNSDMKLTLRVGDKAHADARYPSMNATVRQGNPWVDVGG